MNMKKSITPKIKKEHKIDPKAIQPCLAFLPLETIKLNIDLSILSAMVGNPSRAQYDEHRCPLGEGGYE